MPKNTVVISETFPAPRGGRTRHRQDDRVQALNERVKTMNSQTIPSDVLYEGAMT